MQPVSLIVAALLILPGMQALAQDQADEGPYDDAIANESLSRDSLAPQADNKDESLMPPIRRGISKRIDDLAIPIEALVPDTLSGEKECDREEEPPSACAWAGAADALVVASIRQLRLVAEDAIAADGKGGWQDVANCRLANPALAIDLQVLTLLSGDAPETFTLMVGAEQTARFKPLPMREIDSRVQWAQSNDRSTGALREGMRIVTPAHRVGKTWSLMGDVILGIDENDVVYLPRRTGDCLNTLPQELNGADIGAIQERLGQCSGKDETQIGYRISLREALWGEQQPRSFYASAYCTDSIESFEDTTGLGSESIDSPMTEDAEN